MLRRLTAPELNARKQYCKHGHPLFGDNLRINKNTTGGIMRVCRTCEAARSKHKVRKPRTPEQEVARHEKQKLKRKMERENKILEAAKIIAERRAADSNI